MLPLLARQLGLKQISSELMAGDIYAGLSILVALLWFTVGKKYSKGML